MGEQYYKGVLAAFLGANFMNGKVLEWQVDAIKEYIAHYYVSMIDHSQLSFKEKKEQKQQMKQSLEEYFRGLKYQLRQEGRLE